jgi:hypothetical protein
MGPAPRPAQSGAQQNAPVKSFQPCRLGDRCALRHALTADRVRRVRGSQGETGLAAAGYADRRHAPGTSEVPLKSSAGAGLPACRPRSSPPADRQAGEHDGEAGIDRTALRWQTGRAGRPGLDARKLFPRFHRTWQLPATKPPDKLKAAAFGVTTGERPASASRPWPSVETPPVCQRPLGNPVGWSGLLRAGGHQFSRLVAACSPGGRGFRLPGGSPPCLRGLRRAGVSRPW